MGSLFPAHPHVHFFAQVLLRAADLRTVPELRGTFFKEPGCFVLQHKHTHCYLTFRMIPNWMKDLLDWSADGTLKDNNKSDLLAIAKYAY